MAEAMNGGVAVPMAFQVSMQDWQKWAPYLFLLGAALLMLVLIPGIGREVNGSRRWLPLLIINRQHQPTNDLISCIEQPEGKTK